MLDHDRLAKLLALTASPNDNEALAAMRKANEIMKGEDLTWAELLASDNLRAPHVTVTVSRGFAHPEFYAAMEEWTIRQKR